MTSGWVAIVMLLVFVAVAAAFAWQERARLPERSFIYGSDDAVSYVTARLSDEARAVLSASDVQRILAWEIEFLQRQMMTGEGTVVVAGLEAARHAQERLHERGFSYDGQFIVEVMELQAEYLAAIGAVAEAAPQEEIDDVFGEGDTSES